MPKSSLHPPLRPPPLPPPPLPHSNGPGSPLSMAPEAIEMRDIIIEKFIDKPLSDLRAFIDTALATEKNEAERIGILAARLFILRMRIMKIKEFNDDLSLKKINAPSPTEITTAQMRTDNQAGKAAEQAHDQTDGKTSPYQDWNELVVIEAGEINGVRIPKGVQITVNAEDAARLIETKKAELVQKDAPEHPPNIDESTDADKPKETAAPKEEPPKDAPLKDKPPKDDTPKDETPKDETPKDDTKQDEVLATPPLPTDPSPQPDPSQPAPSQTEKSTSDDQQKNQD